MPYLRLDLDAKKNCPRVAAACGTDAKTILWGLAELWEWCWTEQVTEVSVSQLPGFFGLRTPELAQALQDFGFITIVSNECIRVKGAETYLRVKEARTRAGKSRAKKANRAGGRFSKPPANHQQTTSIQPALTPSTIHHSPDTNTTAGTETPAGWKELSEGLFAVFEKRRGSKPAPRARDWKALRDLRARVRDNDAEIQRRWERGLRSEFKARCDTFSDLSERWDVLADRRLDGNHTTNGKRAAMIGFPEPDDLGGA